MPDVHNILLDRDGTLIKECHYLCDPAEVTIFPDVFSPMQLLAAQGIRFFLVSNQSGLGRGYFSSTELQNVEQHLTALLAEQGITLTASLHCPHTPEEHCSCRKPGTGMWHVLQQRFNLLPEQSIMIGDKIADIAFGQAANCTQTVLVHTGHGKKNAALLSLPALTAPVMPCAQRPGWPTMQAVSLGAFLQTLVQKNGLGEYAYRI